MRLKIQIHFSSHTIDKTINYPEQNKVVVDFPDVTSNINVDKILINNLPANIYHNTKYQIANSNVTYDSVHLIDSPGTYTLYFDDFYIQSLRAGNWHTSENSEDFIFKYEFTNNSFSNTYRDRDHIGFDKTFTPCFGCSFTYGAYVPAEHSWPALLRKNTNKNFLNLGVEGIGADAIYNNLQLLHNIHDFDHCVILFPAFARRMVQTKIDNLYVRFPSTLKLSYSSFFYSTNDKVLQAFDRVNQQILEDSNNDYSKNFIQKIVNFCNEKKIKLFGSAWTNDVYDYISTLEHITLLPKFTELTKYTERATDKQHPHQRHYEDFTNSIKSFL